MGGYADGFECVQALLLFGSFSVEVEDDLCNSVRIGFDGFHLCFSESVVEFFAVKNPVIERTLFGAVAGGGAKAGDTGLLIL